MINSNVYNKLATQPLWVQFTPSLSDASISRLWLHVYYLRLGRTNTVDYNQLKLIQLVSYAATVSAVYSITQWRLDPSFWLYVYCPTLGRISAVGYNQLKLIQQVSYADTVSTVYSITQWCLNQSALVVCLLPYIGQNKHCRLWSPQNYTIS